MQRQFKLPYFYFLGTLAILTACNKTETADCGCDGSKCQTLENVQPGYLGNVYIQFNKMDHYDHFIYGLACTSHTTWEKSTDISQFNYTVS